MYVILWLNSKIKKMFGYTGMLGACNIFIEIYKEQYISGPYSNSAFNKMLI